MGNLLICSSMELTKNCREIVPSRPGFVNFDPLFTTPRHVLDHLGALPRRIVVPAAAIEVWAFSQFSGRAFSLPYEPHAFDKQIGPKAWRNR